MSVKANHSQNGKNRAPFGGSMNLASYLIENSKRWPDRIALRQKDFGIWIPCTWRECFERARAFGLGLRALGFERGDRLIIIGDNEFETYWGMYGALSLGGAIVGAWVDAMKDEVAYILADCTPRIALVRDQEQVDKLLSISHPHSLQKIIYWEPRGMNEATYVHNSLIASFAEISELGEDRLRQRPGELELATADTPSDAPAMLYYTSGTSGQAKGVVRTHANQLAMGELFQKYFPVDIEDELVCTYPVASIGEPVLGSVRNLLHGATLHFPELPETFARDMREIGPRYLVSLPRTWEDIASRIRARIEGSNAPTRWLFASAVGLGSRRFDAELNGRPASWPLRLAHAIMRAAVLRPNLDRAGLSRVKVGTTAGFMLGSHTFKFLNSCGLRLREFYASTEVPAIATQEQCSLKERSVGRVMEGIELRVTHDHELLIRGALTFDRYHNRPEATRQALDDLGWYPSGDAGYVDDEGYVFFHDRVKELATMAGGTRFSPQFIESELRFGTYIKDAWVIGEARDFVSAIVTLDMESVSRWAERNAVSFTTQIELSQMDVISGRVSEDIEHVNEFLPREIRIQRYLVLHKEFDADEAELTRTRKLRRDALLTKYQTLHEAIYRGDSFVDTDASFRYNDGTVAVVPIRLQIRNVSRSTNATAQHHIAI